MAVLALLVGDVGSVPIDGFTYGWCEQWVQDMKLKANYAPGTIRKRVASLARAVDWFMKRHPDVPLQNPLRMLPRGAATYNAADARKLAADPRGLVPKVDTERDRRLAPAELQRIMDALNGVKRPDRERPMRPPHARALRALFVLILHTGLRLREAYTLTVGQFDMQRRVVRARASKQWHGREKYREVPMTPELFAEMADYLAGMEPAALAFPWWDGDRDIKAMAKVTTRLSNQFARVFDYAQVVDFTEHDLRHETTCRWYEMRRPDGAWVLSEREIDRIMGWAPGSKMAARYASFRADDLAARVWATGQVAEAASPNSTMRRTLRAVDLGVWLRVSKLVVKRFWVSAGLNRPCYTEHLPPANTLHLAGPLAIVVGFVTVVLKVSERSSLRLFGCVVEADAVVVVEAEKLFHRVLQGRSQTLKSNPTPRCSAVHRWCWAALAPASIQACRLLAVPLPAWPRGTPGAS